MGHFQATKASMPALGCSQEGLTEGREKVGKKRAPGAALLLSSLPEVP